MSGMAQQMLVPLREDVLWGHLRTGSRECTGDAVYRLIKAVN